MHQESLVVCNMNPFPLDTIHRVHWTRNSEVPSLSPTPTTTWICFNLGTTEFNSSATPLNSLDWFACHQLWFLTFFMLNLIICLWLFQWSACELAVEYLAKCTCFHFLNNIVCTIFHCTVIFSLFYWVSPVFLSHCCAAFKYLIS